LLYW